MSTSTQRITIDTDGQLRFIDQGGPVPRALGAASKRRASHIEPASRLLRWAFRALRSATPDDSRWAAFSRRWPCRWQVAIVNGPTFGSFRDRSAAIAAEVKWIERHEL